jgi:hypothetical protein
MFRSDRPEGKIAPAVSEGCSRITTKTIPAAETRSRAGGTVYELAHAVAEARVRQQRRAEELEKRILALRSQISPSTTKLLVRFKIPSNR